MAATVGSENYTYSLTESFPNPRTSFKIETGIVGRINRDYLPLNANLDTSQINDSYIEFNLNASDREFFNLGKIHLELQLQILKADGEAIGDADHVSVIDALGYSVISRCNVFLNSTPVESNPHFGVLNTVKNYLSMGWEEYKTHGRMNFHKNIIIDCPDTITDAYFAPDTQSNYEKDIIASTKNVIHLLAPLNLDISSAGFYMLDNVEIRIRLDLQPANYILLTSEGEEFKYKVKLAKLHIEKVTPQPAALLSLNKALTEEGSSVQYLINRPVTRVSMFPQGYTSLTLDNIFNGFIPSKLIIFFIAQNAMAGSYQRNPLYLNNCNIETIRLEIDGQLQSINTGNFTDRYSQFLSNTLHNIDTKENMLTVRNFKRGRTIFVYDLQPSESEDVLHIERRGNLRISISLAQEGLAENTAMYCVGMTTGNVHINAERIVKTSFLM